MIVYITFGKMWYTLTESADMDEIVATANVLMVLIVTIYRYIDLMSNRQFFINLAKSMDSPHSGFIQKRGKIIEEWAKRHQNYFNLLYGLGISTLTVWNIFPTLDNIKYNLVMGIRLPFNYRTPLLYPPTYIVVSVSLVYISSFAMLMDSTIQAYLMQILCQFAVLADCFENSLNDCVVEFEGLKHTDLVHDKKFVDKYMKQLRDLVEQHKIILNHTMNLRRMLSGQMLGQFAASGTVICLVAYQSATAIGVSIGKCMMSCLLLSYNAFVLFIICKWSEEITNASRKIGEAIYFSGWECGVCNIRGVRSIIMFVIARANKPLVLTAGGMYNLSLASYGSLIKGSYSALMMLLGFR